MVRALRFMLQFLRLVILCKRPLNLVSVYRILAGFQSSAAVVGG